MEENIHNNNQQSKGIKGNILGDKRRLVEKEEERVHQARKDKVNFTFSWIAIILRGIVGTFVSLFVFTQANRIEDEDKLSRLYLLADLNLSSIKGNLSFVMQELQSAGSLYQIYPQTTESQFTNFTKPLIKNHPYIKNISWHPTPFNQETISVTDANAVEEATKKNMITASLPPVLRGSSLNQTTITLFVPIKEFQSKEVAGIIEASIDFGALVYRSIHNANHKNLNIYIYENSSQTSPWLFYVYNKEPQYDKKLVPTPADVDQFPFSTKRTLSIGDVNFAIIYQATTQFITHSWQATIAAGIGFFFTFFIVITAWLLLEIEKRQFSNLLHEEHIQEIEGTIDLLETTKNRMVAQENLASLGGLTAGIAHEIKNPLNFINNFSTLSIELIQDIYGFLNKYRQIGTPEERNTIYESIQNLKENISTIHEQGQRADNTIQRMLAHSRGKPGEWLITDIHKLLEEYINFSYHGMRAKNSNFNVKIEKEFNSAVKDVEVVGNDMSRVFLNILNNSFQSIEEKQKKCGNIYTAPLVSIRTQTVGNYMRVRIRDNGMGISEDNKANIFTPFFTTKPTGIGTGLGLSLSYNIIVREHGGSLTFDSKENEYCEFIMTIPLQPKKGKEVVAQ